METRGKQNKTKIKVVKVIRGLVGRRQKGG
jgi:hypothetical protein